MLLSTGHFLKVSLCDPAFFRGCLNAFSAYNKRFEGESEYDWVTSDREVTAKYAADEYCTFKFTVSAMHDLVKLNMLSNRGAWFKNMRKNLPVFLISGTHDPVGNYGNGIKTVYKRLKAAGMEDVTIKLYENCRHEIHNDICRQDVMNDILEFIEK